MEHVWPGTPHLRLSSNSGSEEELREFPLRGNCSVFKILWEQRVTGGSLEVGMQRKLLRPSCHQGAHPGSGSALMCPRAGNPPQRSYSPLGGHGPKALLWVSAVIFSAVFQAEITLALITSQHKIHSISPPSPWQKESEERKSRKRSPFNLMSSLSHNRGRLSNRVHCRLSDLNTQLKTEELGFSEIYLVYAMLILSPQ